MYTNKHDVWVSNGKYTCRLCDDQVDKVDTKWLFRKQCPVWEDIKSTYAATTANG